MPDRGFSLPWVLFLGNLWPQERAYVAQVLAAARKAGYDRLVEPAAGTFAVSLLAADAGWDPAKMEASDVSLYSSALGFAIEGRDLAGLGVTVDGEPLDLPGTPVEQAAHLLWRHVVVRGEARQARNPTSYLAEVLKDLMDRADEHRASIADHVRPLTERLKGLRYRPMDCVEHVAATASTRGTLVVCNPPTISAGYEKFFSTEGRVRWQEPSYATFDPKFGPGQVVAVGGGESLVLCVQECEPGRQSVPNPVFARQVARNRYTYYLANRPAEVRGLVGGVKVMPRTFPSTAPAAARMADPDTDLDDGTEVAVARITASEAGWYKDLWHHGFESKGSGHNMAVLLDGCVAGIAGVDSTQITHAWSADGKWGDCLLLTYNFAPASERWRLPRLLTMLCLSKTVVRQVAGPKAAWLELARRAVTVAFSPKPESKPMRGIMKLAERRPEDGAFRLIYVADLNVQTPQAVFADWLARERKWQTQRQTQQDRSPA